MLDSLTSLLSDKNYQIHPDMSGDVQRFDREGKLSGWFVGSQYTINGRTICVANFGDFKTDEEFKWQSETDLNEEEHRALTREVKVLREKEKKAREENWELVSAECERLWRESGYRPYGTHEYLERKKISGLFGARIDESNNASILVIPVQDLNGKIWGFQRIKPNGEKRFYSGTKISQNFFQIVPENWAGGKIFIVEGFATGASVYMALDKKERVVCAFNCANLSDVAKIFNERYPECLIVVCADNDSSTNGNPGKTHGARAAGVSGGVCVTPIFQDYRDNPTDFNDLHCREGLQVVRSQVEDATAKGMPLISIGDGMSKGKKDKPSEILVVKALLRHYGDDLCKHQKNLFKFERTHWKRLDESEVDQIKMQIQLIAGGSYEFRQIQSAYNQLLLFVPSAPVDMFAPRPFYANFLNGTLHIERDTNHKYKKIFKPHSALDYLTNVIPLNYEEQRSSQNALFLEMIERVFEGDTDKAEKIRAIKQMYGACLIPLFPHLFMLHGPGGSGKSTLIIPARRLISGENICSVEPHEFKGFLMESMIGKLVNIVLDINTNVAIDDAMVKKIEDRVPVRVDRKFLGAVLMPLPAVHIFGGNAIPRTYSGGSRAHERRWSFIEVSRFQAEGQYKKDFANWVFDQNPQGVLNFALEGLDDLLEHDGHFLNPESGKATMRDWQLNHDAMGQFFKDIEENEVDNNNQLIVMEGAQIERKKVWDAFKTWHVGSLGFAPKTSKHRFYTELYSRGFGVKTIMGVRYFTGIGVKPKDGAEY